MKLEFNNINPNKLHDELIINGIIPILVENDCKEGEYIAGNTMITFEDDAYTTKINEIVAKHDRTPVMLQPTDNERLASIEIALTTLMGV